MNEPTVTVLSLTEEGKAQVWAFVRHYGRLVRELDGDPTVTSTGGKSEPIVEQSEMIERVVLWARDLRMKHDAILGVILAGHKAVQVTMEDGESEPSLRLRPDMKVEIIDDELGLERVEFET